MEVKPGYRQTEIGVIPEDWSVTKLGELSRIHRGASPRPIDDPKWFNSTSDIGWVRIQDVSKANKYLFFTLQWLTQEGINNSRFVPRDSLIMSICASLGKPIITKIDVCIHDGFVVFERCSCDRDYLYYVLKYIESKWPNYGQVGTQLNLNTGLIQNHPIALPMLSIEQKSISGLLSDIDSLINSLEKLIEKKKNIKQGMMQELLTGKRRLPGFTEKWETIVLGDLIDSIADGGTPSTKDQSNFGGSVNWAVIDDIADDINSTRNTLSDRGLNKSSAKLWPKGSLIISTGATLGVVGIAQVPLATKQGICGIVFDGKRADVTYFRYWFKNNRATFLEMAQGSTIKEVRPPLIKKIECHVPRVEEQRAIAHVLRDMDKDISVCEEHLIKYRDVKSGMMQELLTGRIRLI